ncbi:MAG: metallopeptidase TldD-related protein [Candidatus Kariarchaeaceae archaeon]
MILHEYSLDKHYSTIDWLMDIARQKYSIDELEIYLIGESRFLIKEEPLSSLNCQLVKADSLGLAIRTVKNQKLGFATTDLLSQDKIEKTLLAALEHSRPLPFKRSLFTETHQTSFNLKDKKLMDVQVEELLEQLKQASDELNSHQDIKYSKGRVNISYSYKSILNLEGMKCEEEKTLYHARMMGVNTKGEMSIENGDEQYSNNYDIDFTQLTSKAIHWINSTKAAHKKDITKETSIFMTSEGMASLLEPFIVSLYGDYSNKMFMENLQNSQIASSLINLSDEPQCSFSPFKSSFDSEGSKRNKLKIVDQGTLNSFIYDKMTAFTNEKETTAHSKRFHLELGGSTKPSFLDYKAYPRIGFSNLVLKPGEETLYERLQDVKDGIIIQHLGNTHSNNIAEGNFNGTVFRGSEVIDGEIVNGVTGLNWAGSVINLLKNIVWLSSDRKFYNHPESSTGFYLPFIEIQQKTNTFDLS